MILEISALLATWVQLERLALLVLLGQRVQQEQQEPPALQAQQGKQAPQVKLGLRALQVKLGLLVRQELLALQA